MIFQQQKLSSSFSVDIFRFDYNVISNYGPYIKDKVICCSRGYYCFAHRDLHRYVLKIKTESKSCANYTSADMMCIITEVMETIYYVINR